jgi:hypothetical protein
MTLNDFTAFLQGKGLDRLAYLVGRHPDVVEPFLGKIEGRLREKGLLAKSYTPVSVGYSRRAPGKHSQGTGGEYESIDDANYRVSTARALAKARGRELAKLDLSKWGNAVAEVAEADVAALTEAYANGDKSAGDRAAAILATAQVKLDDARDNGNYLGYAKQHLARLRTALSAAYEASKRGPRALTDHEGWSQLAELVDSALSDQPDALREALKTAFREEARKAA